MAGIWNQDFKEVVKEGASGNQSQRGIFYEDDRKKWKRLTSAEGHEISKNPEEIERNPIGQSTPSKEIRSYNDSFDKEIIIKKGDLDYEFFNNWMERRPIGDNAKLKIAIVDFMKEEIGTVHNKYLAESYMATVTVSTANFTDGTISVSFSQDGDVTTGIIQRIDCSTSSNQATFAYGFTPAAKIAITNINVSEESVSIPIGGEARVAVSFSPLGCPFDFTVESGNDNIVTVKRWQQSVDITGLKTGTVTVTVKSTFDQAVVAEIEVIVA